VVSDIAYLLAKHILVVVVRDNDSENKSQEIKDFFESKGIRNHFSIPHEQWQNGPAESTINSIILIARTVMVESGLGGRFWFRAATAGFDARNTTFKARIGITQHHLIYGQKKDVSSFLAFGCRAWVYIDPERLAKGKHTPRAEEAIYVGFAINTSVWSFYVLERKKILTTNQVIRFIMTISVILWFCWWYPRTIHSLVQVRLSLHTGKSRHREQANFPGVKHSTLKGQDPRINPDKPPRNFRVARKALDKQAWAGACDSEYLGFVERGEFKVVKPEQEAKIRYRITRLGYKEDNGDFLKIKARMCVRGDQQKAGVSFKETDLYAPVLKGAEA
jgi:hypothetical protein